jgi:hypothetical protein
MGMRRQAALSCALTAGLLAWGLTFPGTGFAWAQPYPLVSEANVVNLKLNHYFTLDKRPHAPDFEWAFTKTTFVLKKGTGAIPPSLTEQLLGKGATADEIRGTWKLAGSGGQQLVLTDITAGEKIGKAEVALTISKTAPSVVRIGDPQYVFAIGD